MGEGSIWSSIDEKTQVFEMECSIADNLGGPQESMFSLFRGPQLHFGKAQNKLSNRIDISPLPLFTSVWSLALGSFCVCLEHYVLLFLV